MRLTWFVDETPVPGVLVLAGWIKRPVNEVALVRYIPAHGWLYIDGSVCPLEPDCWADIPPLPNKETSRRICDFVGCNEFAEEYVRPGTAALVMVCPLHYDVCWC